MSEFEKVSENRTGLIQSLIIEKEEILNLDFRKIEEFLGMGAYNLISRESLILDVSGYEEKDRELCNITEVRNYFRELLKRYPYIFYYLVEECWEILYLCSCTNITRTKLDATSESNTIYTRRDVEFSTEVLEGCIYFKDIEFDDDYALFIERLRDFMFKEEVEYGYK